MSEQIGPAHPDEVLAAAERYAKAGLKIYPVYIPGLKPDGKKDVRPAVKSWSAEATNDLEQVRAWWGGQHRGAGIGVDMGRSHLAVADADVKDGVDGITRLITEMGLDGQHAESRTPSGGLHAWFSDPDGEMGSGSNIFGDKNHPSGVDGRGVGGTIFMPPTFVPGYGRYEWADGEPDWSNLPRVPRELAAACPPGGRRKSAAVPGTQQDAAQVRGGTQQSQLFAGPAVVHRDRPMDIESAKARLMPLWEAVRDTKVPNGLWQAVADFTRAAAHYQCFWDAEAVGRMVLAAYADGGHGYTELDEGDLRAIEKGYALQEQARAAGDLDEGWVAIPSLPSGLAPAEVADDAVEALLAEMLTPSEIKARPGKQYLIKGLLNLDSESWMIGPPGARKSFVALDMAGHIAAGRDWQGLKVRQGSVVIIAAEGAGGIGARVKAWELEHGPMPDCVHILPRPVQAADAGAWAVLVKACEHLEPVLVIADTQARVTVGLEENSATDMGRFVHALTAIRQATGACVMPLHHTGRSGGDARGSSAIDGAQDTELKVVAGGEPLTGELRIEKQKDLPEREPVKLRFAVHVVGQDEDGDAVTSLALRGQDAWESASGVSVEVEPWEAGHAEVVVHLFKVLRDQGAEGGLTKAEAKHAVIERGYGGDVKRLNRSTWYTGWDRALAKRSVSGDPVMVNVRGEKWSIDPVALADLEPVVGGRSPARTDI